MKTQFIEIYRCEGMILGTPLRATTTYQCRLEYENCFNLPGRTACFFLVSRDDTIQRSEAIAFAASIANGKMVLRHIDLSQLGTTREVKNGSKATVKAVAQAKINGATVLETTQLAMEELFR